MDRARTWKVNAFPVLMGDVQEFLAGDIERDVLRSRYDTLLETWRKYETEIEADPNVVTLGRK